MKHIKWLAAALVLLISLPAFAKQVRYVGLLDVGRTSPLYIDYLKNDRSDSTLVLLNGLTYDTDDWNQMMPTLKKGGYSILRYDMRGQGKTLTNHGAETEVIRIEDQAEDLAALLDTLGLTDKVDLMGLSYGGGLITEFAYHYPKRVKNMILVSPFVGPMQATHVWIQLQVDITRLMNPLLPWTNEQLYRYYLTMFYYGTAPMTEPSILQNPLSLQATLHMTQGLWTSPDKLVKRFPRESAHLVLAKQDQYMKEKEFDQFWDKVPESAKASRLMIDGSEHKIPESVPTYAAGWVNLIVNGDERISGNRRFAGDARKGTAVSEDGIKIKLPKQ